MQEVEVAPELLAKVEPLGEGDLTNIELVKQRVQNYEHRLA